MLIEDVEHLIEDYYETIRVGGETRQSLAGMLHAEFDQLMASETKELARLANDRDQLDHDQLDHECTKLLQAHYAGAAPIDLLKKEQDRISALLENITNRIAVHHEEYASARESLEDSLALLVNAEQQANALDWAAAAAGAKTKKVRFKPSQDWRILSRV